jgi:hypothetical protein
VHKDLFANILLSKKENSWAGSKKTSGKDPEVAAFFYLII